MRHRKLYNSIEVLIQNKKNSQCSPENISAVSEALKKHEKKRIVEKYCAEQMKKKKLVSKNNVSRINQIMKNFEAIQTYVSVEDLIQCINDIYVQERKVKFEKQNMKSKSEQLEDLICSFMAENINSTNQTEENSHKLQKILVKARKHLEMKIDTDVRHSQQQPPKLKSHGRTDTDSPSTFFKRSREDRSVERVLKYLEQKSDCTSQQINNRQKNIFLYHFGKKNKEKKSINLNQSFIEDGQEEHDKKTIAKAHKNKQESKASTWNYYSRASSGPIYRKIYSQPDQNAKMQSLKNQQDPFSVLQDIGNINEANRVQDKIIQDAEVSLMNKQKRKMLKLARIYLHMILENEHKKKWNPPKKNSKKNKNGDLQEIQKDQFPKQLIKDEQYQELNLIAETVRKNKRQSASFAKEKESLQIKSILSPLNKMHSNLNHNFSKKNCTKGKRQNIRASTETNQAFVKTFPQGNTFENQVKKLKPKMSNNFQRKLFNGKQCTGNIFQKTMKAKTAKECNSKIYPANNSISLALKQIGNFLTNLEEDQFIIKKQIAEDLKNIDIMEKKLSEKQRYKRNEQQYNTIKSRKQTSGTEHQEVENYSNSAFFIFQDDQKLQNIKKAINNQQSFNRHDHSKKKTRN